jgi:hypothetical protein
VTESESIIVPADDASWMHCYTMPADYPPPPPALWEACRRFAVLVQRERTTGQMDMTAYSEALGSLHAQALLWAETDRR